MITLWLAQSAAVADAPPGGWLVDPELVGKAYGQTMAGGTIQTRFPPPQPQPQTPEWLAAIFRAIGNFIQWASPAFTPIAWIAAGLLVLFLLYHFVPAFAEWIDNLPLRRKQPDEDLDNAVGQAEAGAARARLADADALAREGRFAEAVHMLLYRSVEDITSRRPGLVQPAMTSRELAMAGELPGVARTAFSQIARAVEVSLFGGRAIDSGAWDQCRAAYSELTIARNWARA